MRRLAITVAALVSLAACGGGSADSGSPEDSGTTGVTAAAEPAVTEPANTTPPQTEPEQAEPVQTEPEQTAPPQTEPPATDPIDAEPPEPDAPISEFPTVAALVNAGYPINLSHAGGDQAAPHSTMFAFREGVAAGADALEMDVQLTADGVLIVQHDDTVDKTTNATGPVGDLTLDEIQALDNAHWFSPQCWPCQDRPLAEYVYRGMRTGEVPAPEGYSPDDFRVETFQSIAEAFPHHVLDVEIKGSYPDAIPVVEQLAEQVNELDLADRIVVVSFDDQLLDAFHKLAPDVALSPGLTRLTDWFLNGAEIEPYFTVFQAPPFQGDIEVINAETVQRIHDEGRVIWAWPNDASTQENAEFYDVLIDAGVDGIITGRPAEMVDALSN